MKRIVLYVLALTILCTTAARAQTTWYVLIPSVANPGVGSTKVEMQRTNLSLTDVQTTWAPDGTSGLDATASTQQIYIGPSTVKTSPLLELTKVATGGGGMVILDPVPGLNAVEVSYEIQESPIKDAWKLPLLTSSQFYGAHAIAYVLNLVKGTDAESNLQIFNPGTLASTCALQVLRPKGTVIETRTNIGVPAEGAILISDILREVKAVPSSGINVAVSCDSPFYAMGTYPAANVNQSEVEYPVAALPGVTTAVTLEDRPGVFLNATNENDANLLIPLALDPAINYHTVTINFDGAVANPPAFLVYWNICGLYRHGGRRFDKTLFFGNFYNYDKQKYVMDVGTPYIETTVKYVFPLLPGDHYHWSITLNNDEQSNHYVITAGNGDVLMDVLIGLYNPVATDAAGDQATLQIGLGGIADHAYFPPVGWRFSNLSIVATK